MIGCTSGIGLALAERMIAGGSRVIGVGRRQDKLDELASRFGSDSFSSAQFDITDLQGIPNLISRFVQRQNLLYL